MVDDLPFMGTILADPHSWVPRLVYADWLEEQGATARAELIRLLHLLHTGDPVPDRPRREARLRELMAAGTVPAAATFTNSIGAEFVLLPPGTFRMGSPRNERGRESTEARHVVTLTRGFLIGRFPVTQAQWDRLDLPNPSQWRGADRPVDSVNFLHGQEFCRRLSEAEGRTYRLPTEAEWEYACRAGTSAAFHVGRALGAEQGNVDFRGPPTGKRAARRRGWGTSSPVGRFPPNAWGLFDMHGNVWEWCADTHGAFGRAAATDPLAAGGAEHVLRGGSWYNPAERARSAARHYLMPNVTGSAIGLRLCLDV